MRFAVALIVVMACSESGSTESGTNESETNESENSESENSEFAANESETSESSSEDLVDLLPTHATHLAVSSTTPSLRSGPRFLLDGAFDTPWASKSGDDAAFIEVRLPADVHVKQIQLTAGFTAIDGRHDRFTQNLRVSRVRVLHEGELVATADLDTDSRELQNIDVDARGGVWRIELDGLVPGTMPGYREVCVSELRVLGFAPPSNSTGPSLHLGSLDGLSIEAIRTARVQLASMNVTPGSFDDWWTNTLIALQAFPMRCAFPRLRRALARKALRAYELEGQAQEAGQVINDVACPGPGLSGAAYEILGDIRDEAEGRLEDVAEDRSLAFSDLTIVYGEWAHHCEQRIVRNPDRMRDDERAWTNAMFELDQEIARLAR